MIETIYIARHGFRLNWVTTNWNSPTGLPRDPPLAAYGETQAEELAKHFLSLPESERPTAIISSPYYRCLQTAKPTSIGLRLPILVEHGLSEWYSPVKPGSGLHPRPSPANELRKYIPQIDATWSSVWMPSRKGETIEEVHDRTAGCLDALIPSLERKFLGKHKRVLLVTHAATAIALVHELLGDRNVPLRVGCCSLSVLSRKPGRQDVLGAWDAYGVLASGSHLSEGASRDWGFEDVEIAAGQVVEDPGIGAEQSDVSEPVGSQVADNLARM